jgi:hypothetical protein
MKSLSTQCANKTIKNGKGPDGKDSRPCKKTLNLLAQFARTYHAEPSIQQELCGFILN